MNGYSIAVTGYGFLTSKGIAAGMRPKEKRVPAMPVHAAHSGDTEAVCGTPVRDVTDWPWGSRSMMEQCRNCADLVSGGLSK